MTDFTMFAGGRQASPLTQVVSWVLWAPRGVCQRLIRMQREYLAIQHLQSAERERLDDIGLERCQIVAAVRGRRGS